MGGSDKPKDPPPLPPVPKESNTTEAVDLLVSDRKRLRRGFLSSADDAMGGTGAAGTGGSSFLG